MTITRVGSTSQYSDGWEKAFGTGKSKKSATGKDSAKGGKKAAPKAAVKKAAKKAPAKKAPVKKTAQKKTAQKKKK